MRPVSASVLDTVLDRDDRRRADLGGPPAGPVRPVAGGRHEARERAIHLLYEAQIKGLGIDEVLARRCSHPSRTPIELVRGVVRRRAALDEIIERLARGWTVERMPTLDLVVLEVACFELAHCAEVPRGVVLAEAVDLAGRYGTDDSARFVNGLLAAAADELRRD